VTGAASGIGLAIAKLFATHEAETVLLDLDAPSVSEAARTIAAETGAPASAMPEEMAVLALCLCSDEASFITGVDCPIDGGFLNLR